MNFLYVFIGGGFGSIIRFTLSIVFARITWLNLPLATLSANIISCVVFAITWVYLGDRFIITTPAKLLLLTGFCGGLSTFSTFSFETFELFRRGDYIFALINILLNMLLCLVIFVLFAKKQA